MSTMKESKLLRNANSCIFYHLTIFIILIFSSGASHQVIMQKPSLAIYGKMTNPA